ELAKRLGARGISGLQAYSPASHHAMLAGFPYIDAIVADAVNVPPITDASPTVIDDIDINSQGDLSVNEGRAAAQAQPAGTAKRADKARATVRKAVASVQAKVAKVFGTFKAKAKVTGKSTVGKAKTTIKKAKTSVAKAKTKAKAKLKAKSKRR
ncbi:MAG: hypothetical protein H0W72_16900, partial [Planctomycetes bacterium]|nr:hypothetical protein [Planctomycetota bacterium]